MTRGDGDELLVEDLFQDWPEDEAGVLARRDIVRATPLHQRMVIGDDERHTAVVLELDAWIFEDEGDDLLEGFADASEESEHEGVVKRAIDGTADQAIVDAVDGVLARFERPDVGMAVSGVPSLNVSIVRSVGESIALFLALSFVLVIFVLSVLLRRLSGVLLPLLVVIAALLTTLGFVGSRGVAVNMTVQILPSFLMAIGASASIHILVFFFRSYDTGASREEALRDALRHTGLPITMAALTTAAGLSSFLISELMVVRDLGVIAPVGILLALVYVLTLLPALLCLVPLARREPEKGDAHSRIADAIVSAGDWSVRHPRRVLLATAAATLAGLVGASQIVFDTNAVDSIHPDDPFHANLALSNEQLAGSTSLELVIDTGEVNGLHDPDRQRALAELADWIEAFDDDAPFVRKTLSVNDVLKEIHRALNENRPEFYTTPSDRTLIAQELLLFENSGSDDLEDLVDSEFRMARLSVPAIWNSAGFYSTRIPKILEAAREHFPGAEVHVTGLMTIAAASIYESQWGMLRSYTVALATITPLMMLLVGTLRGGLSSMVPNLIPLILVIGAFGWLRVPLDIFATMTGSIAIGLAVDDTIHFFHAFYRDFARTGDTRLSVRRTLESTGRALLTTTIVLSIGFSVFMFSPVEPVRVFGYATTLAIIFAFLADVLIGPALLAFATKGREREGVTPLV